MGGEGCGDWDWACRIPPDDIYSRLESAIALARSWGKVVVASAGNEGVEISSANTYPLPCNLSGVICVGGVGSDGMNDYNFGSAVDIWAPTHILSTVTPLSADADGNDVGQDEVAGFGGTSAAAPFVSGVIGLMKALNHAISPQSVLDILQMTANPSPDPRVAHLLSRSKMGAHAQFSQWQEHQIQDRSCQTHRPPRRRSSTGRARPAECPI